jgi:hypothetical protein
MYVYIYLIRREGLKVRWEVRREGFLTYDFYYTRCKFLRREEHKICIGWDFYVFCRSNFYIVWHFFTSCGTFLHRVALFYIVWHFSTSGVFFYIWLFQCTGTKNFGRCSCAKKRKYFGSFNDEHFSFIQWWECHFIFRFHWETKLSTMRRQSSLQWYVPEVRNRNSQLPGKIHSHITGI